MAITLSDDPLTIHPMKGVGANISLITSHIESKKGAKLESHVSLITSPPIASPSPAAANTNLNWTFASVLKKFVRVKKSCTAKCSASTVTAVASATGRPLAPITSVGSMNNDNVTIASNHGKHTDELATDSPE